MNLKINNFLLLTVAGLINAFGVTFFLAPVKLYDSGIIENHHPRNRPESVYLDKRSRKRFQLECG